MEHIHGVDVSWMTHGSTIDKLARTPSWNNPSPHSQQPPPRTRDTSASNAINENPSVVRETGGGAQTTPTRPTPNRTSSDEKRSSQAPPPGLSPQRRASWLSSLSSKVFSGNGSTQSLPQTNNTPPKPAEFSVPKVTPAKNAVLQHASKHEGEGPYTPAPPRSSQGGLLHALRRLSSSNGTLNPNQRPHNGGLVERRVLNVDRQRHRCGIAGLNQAKLRRVAFCVDVEIAPAPRYADDGTDKKASSKAGKDQKKKSKDKDKGEVESNGGDAKVVDKASAESPKASSDSIGSASAIPSEGTVSTEKTSSSDSKKKEKKKKSEEERKARKEKKRKQAEANGSIPMEIHCDSDSSSSSQSGSMPTGGRTQSTPTTNPVRIYRRCCQLRETPILKKITEQLTDPANCSPGEPGTVEKLDLTGYWMQLPDLVTLGDYLAVVPVREVVLEKCGLTDEGLRVILAGLLAVRRGRAKRKKPLQQQQQSSQLNGNTDLTQQGGVVEKLVLKHNNIGPEGWRHICLFLYLCRTLKTLDLTGLAFPKNGAAGKNALCQLLARSLADRLGGSTLSLLSLGQTELNTEQLGIIIDGVIKCGVKRLGLAHNLIDGQGMVHVARLLRSGVCEGLDLGGNNLKDQLGLLADALIPESCPLWALSLADCELTPSSLCKLFPKLVKLSHFRFIDLSHNPALFKGDTSAVAVLRRYLPKMQALKRIHLANCSLSVEQVIALTEILPEITGLAHISFLQNPRLVELTTNATTDETKEEACALFASLLAAARVSSSLVAIDIEVPGEQSSGLVKAMAKQVVAYGLRNLARLPVSELAMAATESSQTDHTAAPDAVTEPQYPEALQRLIGHDVTVSSDADTDVDAAPDDDYVIGGTGVAKALTCCLKNRGDESRRQSGEFIRDVENGVLLSRTRPSCLPGGKAKETSKHLLQSARKIRLRLQPAISKAKAAANDTHAYHKLMFLDSTLNGIIKRFEDEFPDTRVSVDSGISIPTPPSPSSSFVPPTLSQQDSALQESALLSDNDLDDEAEADLSLIGGATQMARTGSMISLGGKALADEEGRVLRAGHTFRVGIIKPEHYALLASGAEMVGADPRHVRLLHEMLDEIGDETLTKEAETNGAVAVFVNHRDEILEKLQCKAEPGDWDRFVEAQEKARANAVSSKVDGEKD